MSESTSLEKLVQEMRSLRKIAINQQETLAGISAMLRVHTTSLRMHQRVIEQLAAESGMAFSPDADPVN